MDMEKKAGKKMCPPGKICKDRGQLQERPCSSDDPCPAQWSEWSDWSTCTVTCGYGVSSRDRECIGGEDCLGESAEGKQCFDEYCPPLYSSWTTWTSCSEPCGGGHRSRQRSCLNSRDAPCSEDIVEVGMCNTEDCRNPFSSWPMSEANSPVTKGTSKCDITKLTDVRSTGYCRNQLNSCSEESSEGDQVRRVCARACCQQQKAVTGCTDHPLWAEECRYLVVYCADFGMRDNKAHLGCKKTCGLCY